jgi:hypothetical protein
MALRALRFASLIQSAGVGEALSRLTYSSLLQADLKGFPVMPRSAVNSWDRPSVNLVLADGFPVYGSNDNIECG